MDAERTEGMAQPMRADFGKTGGFADPVDMAAERVFPARVDELRRSVGGFDKITEPVNEDRHVAPGYNDYYAALSRKLTDAAGRNPLYRLTFETAAALCAVLIKNMVVENIPVIGGFLAEVINAIEARM